MMFKLGDEHRLMMKQNCQTNHEIILVHIDQHIQEYTNFHFSQRKWQEGLCKGWKVNRVVSVETCLERELISLEELSFHLTLTWGLIRFVNIISFFLALAYFFCLLFYKSFLNMLSFLLLAVYINKSVQLRCMVHVHAHEILKKGQWSSTK